MIEVLLFAGLRESIGKEKITIQAEGMTVDELKKNGLPEHGITDLKNVMIAINEEYSTDDYVLKKGDTVAMIPPVSGG